MLQAHSSTTNKQEHNGLAARIRKIRHDENTRMKIKVSQLQNALTDHALGNLKMLPSQVTAALGLLRKVMPDLAATELSGEVARPTVIRAPETVRDSRAWLEQHGPKRGVKPN